MLQAIVVDDDVVKKPASAKKLAGVMSEDSKKPATAKKHAGGLNQEMLLQEEAQVVAISEHLVMNYLQNDGTAVPAFDEEDRFEEEASSFTGYAWTPKGVDMGNKASFFNRKSKPVAGSSVLAVEFGQFGKGVASTSKLLENGYIQAQSAEALTMEEAEVQANFYVWTPKGIRKGVKAAFFQDDSVPSAGETVTARDFKHFTEILSAKTSDPATALLENEYLAMNTPNARAVRARAVRARAVRARAASLNR